MSTGSKEHDLFNLDEDIDNEDLKCQDSETKRSSQNYQNGQNIEILSASDVTAAMNLSLSSVQEIMCLPTTTLRLLLNFFKWDTAKMLETFYMVSQQQDMLERAGLKPVSQETHIFSSSSECEICFLSSPDEISLTCGHGFCLGCWEEYFTTQIVELGVSQQMECPGAACHTYVEDQFVEKIISSPSVLDKYRHLITDKFVAFNRELAWCPSPQCSKAVKVEVPQVMAVECSCGCSFCFKCGKYNHETVPCRLVDMWDKMVFNVNYFDEVLTRDCPGCGWTIERDGGCNHMTCSRCKTQFCWWCLESHNNHDINVCRKHAVTEEEAEILARKQAKLRFNALSRRKQLLEEVVGTCALANRGYLPPFPKAGGQLAALQVGERNNNVGWMRRNLLGPIRRLGMEDRAPRAIQMRRVILGDLELGQRMGRMTVRDEEDNLGATGREKMEFATVLSDIKSKTNIGREALLCVEKANGLLIEAQKSLINLQVFANFLPPTPNAEVFEMNLILLEDAVSRISVALQKIQNKVGGNMSKEITEILEPMDKQELKDATRFCENRRISVMELVKDGPEGSGWIFTG